MLRCSEGIVTLRGITQRGKFQLINHNENLAVVFEVIPNPSIQLNIEPKRGIIMQQQRKKIRVEVAEDYRQKALEMNWINECITINCTMKTQYNRKMFEQLKLRGWSKVKNSVQILSLPITLSKEAVQIRSELQSSVSNSINEQFKSRGVYSSYSNVDNVNKNRHKISQKLQKQLDYIFQKNRVGSRNLIGSQKLDFEDEMKVSQPLPDFQQNPHPLTIQHSQEYLHQYPSPQKSYPPIHPNHPISPNHHIHPTSPSHDPSNNKKLIQLIMLAALAGFFAALGSNFKQMFA